LTQCVIPCFSYNFAENECCISKGKASRRPKLTPGYWREQYLSNRTRLDLAIQNARADTKERIQFGIQLVEDRTQRESETEGNRVMGKSPAGRPSGLIAGRSSGFMIAVCYMIYAAKMQNHERQYKDVV